MNGRDLAEVVFKIWGAVVLVTLVVSAPAHLTFVVFAFDDLGWGVLAIFAPVLAQALLGLGLLKFAGPIAQRVIPEKGELSLQVTAHELGLLCFALLGIWLCAYGAGEIAKAYYEFYGGFASEDLSFWTYLSGAGGDRFFWNGVIDVIVGLWLFFGRKSIEKIWPGARGVRERSTAA